MSVMQLGAYSRTIRLLLFLCTPCVLDGTCNYFYQLSRLCAAVHASRAFFRRVYKNFIDPESLRVNLSRGRCRCKFHRENQIVSWP